MLPPHQALPPPASPLAAPAAASTPASLVVPHRHLGCASTHRGHLLHCRPCLTGLRGRAAIASRVGRAASRHRSHPLPAAAVRSPDLAAGGVGGGADPDPPSGGRICLRCDRIHSAGRSKPPPPAERAPLLLPRRGEAPPPARFPRCYLPGRPCDFWQRAPMAARWLGRWGMAARAARVSPPSCLRENGARE